MGARSLKRLLEDHKDAILCVIDQGVVSAAGLLTSVLIGRHAPEELGVYYIALSIVLFVRGFQQQMIAVPYTIFHHHHKESLPGYRGSCLTQQFGLVGIALVFLIGLIVASSLGWLETAMVSPLLVLLFLMPALLMREVVRQYCFTHQENIGVLSIDSVISIIQICGLLALGYLGYLSGASAWAVIGLACFVTLCVWYFRTGPKIQFDRKRQLSDWNLNWSFGKWAVGGQLIGSLPTQILPWLLVTAAGTAGTGLFAAAMSLVGIANIFNTGMANFLTPKASQVYVDEGAHGLRRVIFRMALLFLVAVGSFVGLMAVFGGQIALIFGSKYAGLHLAISILAVGKLFEGFAIVASNGLFVMERIRENFYVDAILMVVTITVAILLIPTFGLMGAVWTSLVGAATGAILRFAVLLVFLNRETRSE